MFEKYHLDLRDYKNILKSKNYSSNTIKMYSHFLYEFLIYTDKCRSHLSNKDAERFIIKNCKKSYSYKNQIISSIKLYYKFVLNKTINPTVTERPRKEKKLPRILDKNHVISSINNISNLKHKAILMIGASVGLRVSEVCKLKIKDIDSNRMMIIVRNSKFNKDRLVPLSKQVLHTLRLYYKKYKPREYLFEGQFGGGYSHTSCNNIVKKYLGDDCHYHLLRHFTASNLMEQDVSTRKIQSILGHSSEKTVSIYTHTTVNSLKELPLAI